jgi:carbonic anhydrase/acetyltransferase-like protein (isoleucine patch superfamily)
MLGLLDRVADPHGRTDAHSLDPLAMDTDLEKRFPQLAYLDQTARVHGKVEIGENASLWPYSVIRAEGFHVCIGAFSNLQDHVIVHVGYHKPTVVGAYCSIAHRATLHGCTIADHCLIGIGATVMEGASIGENSIIAGHSFVADGSIVPPNSIAMGTPAKVVRTTNNFVANKLNALMYWRNALCYAKGDHRGWEGPQFAAQMAAWRKEIEGEFAARYP